MKNKCLVLLNIQEKNEYIFQLIKFALEETRIELVIKFYKNSEFKENKLEFYQNILINLYNYVIYFLYNFILRIFRY